MKFPSIYLASRSPRRRELLLQMGVKFSVINPDVDESILSDELPIGYVCRIARAKAKAGKQLLLDGDKSLVLAADTAVIFENKILGKPTSEIDAAQMLERLSGKTHQVLTAVTLENSEHSETVVSTNEVRFAVLSERDIEWYLRTNEGMDKAGGYAVQGQAALFIEHIEGSYSGIMGLPIRETGQLLLNLGK
ncbi:hypothetical protein LCGC14_1414910 [marine sediment metagenome]|uniref:Septum formation protein Maf n=1 Tax=marine sediment metagenome TaxID=412755 RepID=A0A0F9JTH1_9ZZZZ